MKRSALLQEWVGKDGSYAAAVKLYLFAVPDCLPNPSELLNVIPDFLFGSVCIRTAPWKHSQLTYAADRQLTYMHDLEVCALLPIWQPCCMGSQVPINLNLQQPWLRS